MSLAMVDLTNAVTRFQAKFPSANQPDVWRAPGRVNLIGEHTDYNLGLVLPMAIQFACYVLAAPSDDGYLRAYSAQFGELAEWRDSDIPAVRAEGRWSDRVAGVAWALARAGIQVKGKNLFIDSDVPVGAGLSSSAALGVALTLALSNGSAERVAEIARAAEMEFVGVPCGIMDQFVSAHGQKGAAILLDCRNLDWRAVPLPPGISIVVANSMVKHELGNSGYSARVAECAAAARELGVASLRDATLDQIGALEPTLRKRARHVITENARVERFAQAALDGDVELMGRLSVESHESLRDDYQVSCVELDFLVDAALKSAGVLGARMTGGGFGGSTVNLVRPDAVESLKLTLSERYRAFRGIAPDIFVCSASEGAAQIHPNS